MPGYKLASEVKLKGNYTGSHSQFIDNYIENHPTCIVKDVTDCLCAAFDDLTINESSVYRHITDELHFTLTRTQSRIAERNFEDTIEKRRQFVEHLMENSVDFKKNAFL